MGNFSLFRKPKELAAYFGLDPAERQSGTFRGSKNRISKQGAALADGGGQGAIPLACDDGLAGYGAAAVAVKVDSDRLAGSFADIAVAAMDGSTLQRIAVQDFNGLPLCLCTAIVYIRQA